MDPFTVGALGIAGAGTLAATAAGVWGQQQANAANAAAAQKAMDFAASQTATQYQRGVADLRAAGLNPILAATGGMSGGSAAGVSYQEQNPLGGVQSGVGGAVGTAIQASKAKSEIAAMDSTAVKNLADAGLAPQQALKLVADAKLSDAQAGTAQQHARKLELEGDVLLPSAMKGRVIYGAGRYALKKAKEAVEPIPSPSPTRSPTPTREQWGR